MAERDPPGGLLAIDAGVRAGLAFYGDDGRLRWYRSRNYGSVARLRRAAWRVLNDMAPVRFLAVEGGGTAADPWLREAGRRGVEVIQVHAADWREPLLLPRDRRTGAAAKAHADTLARRVIDWSRAPRPTSLRHDAAEAILLGIWAVVEVGWLPALPEAVRRG